VHEIITSPEDYLNISAKDYTGENGQINIICRMIQVFKSAGMNFFDSER
jgi:tRNA pseudouridine-54 N-methylase